MNKELLARLTESLSKFHTLENLNCCITDKNELLAQFSISDTKALFRIMKAFFSGAIEWECNMTGWLSRGVYVSFYTPIDGMDEEDIKRELDYKVCILNT